MAIPGLEMLEGFGTVRTREINRRVNLLVLEEVILGVKHFPADVTLRASLLMDSPLVLTDTF